MMFERLGGLKMVAVIKETNRPLVLISVMLAMFVSAVEATIVTTAMPVIASDLGGFSRYSWIFSAYLLMSTVTVLIYGKLADLFGRKQVFLFGMSLFLIGSILCGFAMSMEQLIIYRLVQGLGAGAVMPIATTIVGDIYTTEERAKIQGYLSSVWGVSAVLGPAIGGGIVAYLSWKYVFWVNIPLGIFAMIGIGFFLKEPESEKEVSIDYQGAILLTAALSFILFWLAEGGQSFSRTSILSLLILLIGISAFLLFIRVEKRAVNPIMPFSLWKNPVILYANLVSFTTGFILMAVSTYLPTFVTGVMGQPAIIAGFTLTAMSIGWPLASSFAGHLLVRYGTFTVAFLGGLALVLGSVLFALMNASSGPLWAATASFFVGVGMGLTSTGFVVTIQGAVPRKERGSATAANMFMRNFGNTVAAAFFGAILNYALLKYFMQKNMSFELDDINLLLTDEGRNSIAVEKIELLQQALTSSLQWVYLGVAVFAVISALLILKIPRGKELAKADE